MRAVRELYHRLWQLANKGALTDDDDKERIKKAVLSLIAIIIAFLSACWGLAYLLLGYLLPGAIPLSYTAISCLSITYFFLTKRYAFFRFSQLLLILLFPFFMQWTLGGFANASIVMVWAFFTPLAAVFFVDTQHAHKWFSAYIFLTLISGIMDILYSGYVAPMPKIANTAFFVLNMALGFVAIYLVLNYFVKDREQSHIMTLKAKEEALAAKLELEKANEILQQNELVIKQLMLTDPLTGVANRRHLDERLALESKRIGRYGGRLSIIITDIDHFKKINDAHGHHTGDEVLKLFASIIRDNIRETDIVARFGGEEFVIVLPETSVKDASALADRIRTNLEQKSANLIKDKVTASFGVAATQSSESAENILKTADHALYAAKKAGRNQVSVAN